MNFFFFFFSVLQTSVFLALKCMTSTIYVTHIYMYKKNLLQIITHDVFKSYFVCEMWVRKTFSCFLYNIKYTNKVFDDGYKTNLSESISRQLTIIARRNVVRPVIIRKKKFFPLGNLRGVFCKNCFQSQHNISTLFRRYKIRDPDFDDGLRFSFFYTAFSFHKL